MRLNRRFQLFVVLSVLVHSVLGFNGDSFVSVLTNIASIFNLSAYGLSGFVQVGIIKFLIFILLFAVLFSVSSYLPFLNSDDSSRNIRVAISIVFSLIAVLFMPANAVEAIGVTWSLLVFLALTLSFDGLIVWFSFKKLPNDAIGALFSVVLLIVAIIVTSTIYAMV